MEGLDNGIPEYDYRIENVVATAKYTSKPQKIDLLRISRREYESEYNPDRFPGLIMRIAKPKATAIVFSTGKLVITGMRKEEDSRVVVDLITKRIQNTGIDINSPSITIRNVVASGNLYMSIDLDAASLVLENAMYEPEVFPGLVYRMQDPKCVFLIFSTGKVVCVGLKSEDVVDGAFIKLRQEVSTVNVMGDDRYEFF